MDELYIPDKKRRRDPVEHAKHVEYCYCSHPTGVHSNGICPFKVAYGEGQMPRDHHFIGPMPCSEVHGTV